MKKTNGSALVNAATGEVVARFGSADNLAFSLPNSKISVAGASVGWEHSGFKVVECMEDDEPQPSDTKRTSETQQLKDGKLVVTPTYVPLSEAEIAARDAPTLEERVAALERKVK